jgi:hypothetical protein
MLCAGPSRPLERVGYVEFEETAEVDGGVDVCNEDVELAEGRRHRRRSSWSRPAVIRAPKRRLSDVVYRHLQADQQQR